MKRMVLLVVLMFSLSFVFAANGWGDTNVGNGSDEVDAVEDEVSDDDYVAPPVSSGGSSSGADSEYTQDFYLALGFAGLGLLIALLFIYLFFRNPKNRWKKKKVSNVILVKNSKVVKS